MHLLHGTPATRVPKVRVVRGPDACAAFLPWLKSCPTPLCGLDCWLRPRPHGQHLSGNSISFNEAPARHGELALTEQGLNSRRPRQTNSLPWLVNSTYTTTTKMALLRTSNGVPILSKDPFRSSEAKELLAVAVKLTSFHHGDTGTLRLG